MLPRGRARLATKPAPTGPQRSAPGVLVTDNWLDGGYIMRITLVRLSNRGVTQFLMITISAMLTALIGRTSAQVEPIATISAIAFMSIGIYLTIDLYVLGKNCPLCAVKTQTANTWLLLLL